MKTLLILGILLIALATCAFAQQNEQTERLETVAEKSQDPLKTWSYLKAAGEEMERRYDEYLCSSLVDCRQCVALRAKYPLFTLFPIYTWPDVRDMSLVERAIAIYARRKALEYTQAHGLAGGMLVFSFLVLLALYTLTGRKTR